MTKQVSLTRFALATTLGLASGSAVLADPAPQYVTGLTVTGVSVAEYNGLAVDINVSATVIAGCSAATAYVVRDSAIQNGALALATSALVAGRQIDVYVSGCDVSGNPTILQVIVH